MNSASRHAGLVVDRLEEPGLPKPEKQRAGVRWDDMPDIPAILVVRAWILT